jgi:hypothetical protein
MAGTTTTTPTWPRLAAPDHHPRDRPVPLALFRSRVRRPASTIHDQVTALAAVPTI